MAEANSLEIVNREAIYVIDKALGGIINRELVSTAEISDVLLDVRSLLTQAEVAPVEV